MDAEVVVVGLGSMGSQAAWRLASRGVNMVGFDRYRPPHTLGSHHGGSRIIRTAYYEAPEYVPLARRSFQLWRQLEQETASSLLTMTGGLDMGPPDSAEYAGALRSALEHGLEHEVLTPAEMARRFPQHVLREGELGLLEAEAGFLLPEDCIGAALSRAASLGADLRFDCAVESVTPNGRGVTVEAGGRRWQARRAVVAAGAWNAKLGLPGLAVPLRVVRQSQAWFGSSQPERHAPSAAPVFIRHVSGDGLPGTGFAYGFPSLDGSTVKVGVAEDHGPVDPDTIDRTPTAGDAAAVSRFVADTMPDLHPEPVRVAVCLQEFSPDHHFVVGPLPGAPEIVALLGFSGHGFKFAAAIGEAAADFATGAGTEMPVGHLSPARFAAA